MFIHDAAQGQVPCASKCIFDLYLIDDSQSIVCSWIALHCVLRWLMCAHIVQFNGQFHEDPKCSRHR